MYLLFEIILVPCMNIVHCWRDRVLVYKIQNKIIAYYVSIKKIISTFD